jgi:serine/threonine protein kinase
MSQPQSVMKLDFSIPGYEIKRELGRGGMAVVYLAVQESFGRDVALKVLPLINANDKTFTERFIREAKIVSRLVHPNIVTVYDVGIHQGHHYLSMEFIPGMDLRKAQARLSRVELVKAIKHVARALDFAGKKGYVHRDIKPENIMLHEEDSRVILMDFGIARGTDTTMSMTATGSAIGTPYYMSPEQTKGKNVDYRSDIYSLGVVLYQMLTGHVPYEADSAVAVGIKHITAPIPVLPKSLKMFQTVINTALAKSPEHRYQSAGEMIQAMDAIPDSLLKLQQDEAEHYRAASLDYNASTISSSENDALNDLPSGKTEVIKTPPPKHQFNAHPVKIKRSSYIEPKPKKRRSRLTSLLYLILAIFVGTIIYKKDNLYQIFKVESSRIESLLTKNNNQPSTSNTTPIQATIPSPIKAPNEQTLTPQQNSTQFIEASLSQEALLLLIDNLDETPENAIKIARFYKQTLKRKPNDLDARQGIKQLRQWYTQQITSALDNNELQIARHRTNMLKQSFPRMSHSPKYVALIKKIKIEEAYVTHLGQAKKYIAFKQFASPADANALSELMAANDIHPGEEDIIKLREEIADFYFTEASEFLKQGRKEKAQRSITIGLKASPSHTDLQSLNVPSKVIKTSSKKISKLLSRATAYYNDEQYFSPAGKNAYDLYRSVLKLDPGNKKARIGLNNIKRYWLGIFNNDLQQGNLDAATSTLAKIQERYAREPDIKEAQAKLARTLVIVQPDISMVLLSTNKLYSLRTPIAALKAHHPVYIGLNFSNFSEVTEPLKLRLIRLTDNASFNTQEIAIQGEQGDKFILLDVENAWLIVGEYRIEFRLGNQVLTQKRFSIH